ncbi:MAG: GldM family protein [Bacteroidia bacterium]
MLSQLASAAGNKLMKIDQFAAKVVAPSKYIRSGEEYKANIFLAGSSSNFTKDNMQVLVGAIYDTVSKKLISEGTPVDFSSGMGNYAVKTTGQGEQSIKGVIRFRNEEGDMEYYPFEDKYTVATPVSAVSADYMNVFYAGLPNAVTISAAGVAPDKLVAKVNGNSAPLVPAGNGKYTIKPVTTGSCEIAVYSREADGQLKLQGTPSKFRIRPVPIPFVKMNGKYALGTLDMKKTETNALAAISADIPGFNLDAKFKMKSFVIYITDNGIMRDYKCIGNNFTPEAKAAIAKMRPGSKIFFEDIHALAPDNTDMVLGNVTIRVKG